MNAQDTVYFTFPVGRLVGGSLHRPRTEDGYGKPLVTRDGKPREEYSFGVAIPKTASTLAAEPWYAPIAALAAAAFPAGQNKLDTFSCKVTDGDSTKPQGRKMIAPSSKKGYPGHWVVFFSGSRPAALWNADGSARLDPAIEVKKGYYVQVMGNSRSNGDLMKPGMYMNATAVGFSAFGEEIKGEEVVPVGFGGALPPGASATPVAAMPAPAAPVAPPLRVTPVAPMAAATRIMTPKANGATYEACIAAGWTDAALREHGMMVGG